MKLSLYAAIFGKGEKKPLKIRGVKVFNNSFLNDRTDKTYLAMRIIHSRKLKEAFQNILEKTVFAHAHILAEGAGGGCPIPPLTHRPIINTYVQELVRLSSNAKLRRNG